MAGVIKLGAVGALRDYLVKQQGNGLAWSRGPANPFSAKVNASSRYDQVDTWNEWIQEDWQQGVGRVDPEAGGYLYAESETRVPNQLILPPLVQLDDLLPTGITGTTYDGRYMPQSVAGTVTVGSGGYTKVAIPFAGYVSAASNVFQIYARIPLGVTVTIAVYDDSTGTPGTLVDSSTVTGTAPDKTFNWFGVVLSGIADDVPLWLVVSPVSASDSLEIAYGTSGYDTASQSYNGSTWSALTGKYLLYTTDMSGSADPNRGLRRFNGKLYLYAGTYLYRFDSVNEQFDSVGTITGSGDVTSIEVFGPTLYFGRSSGNYATMNTSETVSAASTNGKLFLEFKGILYRAWQNDLYYSGDGSTWSGPFTMGGDDVEIRGMAGMGDSLFCATDKALLRFAPGDVVEEVSRFGSEDSTNGVGMLEYQGNLYIPAGGRLFRFDPSGQMMDVWVNRDDDLVTVRVGQVAALTRMNNWLVAYIAPSTADTRPSVWVWQEEGWHFLASALYSPSSNSNYYAIYYDRGTSRLWFTPYSNLTCFIDIDDYTINPYNVSGYLYQPYGWLEQDRFYGGLYLVDKDFESVTIIADNLSTNVNVTVYFQDEDSTGWETLGTATSDGQELRWSDHSTRPQGRWIKLGLLLHTNDGDETPRVRAVVVKYLPMVTDRVRDQITLTLHSNVEMPDGSLDSYTRAQQLAHIESMIESVIPVIYQDPFGTQYETKITDYSMSVPLYDYASGANQINEMDVTLVIEQVPDGTYSA